MSGKAPLLPAATRADIQGFITSGYGHLPHAAYLLLRITDPAKVRGWLRELVPRITTATSWRRAPDRPKVLPQGTSNLAFSYEGLRALGLPERVLRTFPDELREGMAEPQRSRILGDTGENEPKTWEIGGPANPPIHLFLILKSATPDALEASCESERRRIAESGGLEEIEGSPQTGMAGFGAREPFGFRDGIGQPRIQGIKPTGSATGEFLLGYENQFRFITPVPVVPPGEDPRDLLPASANPHHQGERFKDLGKNGTFLVYRKLRQDVAAFWRFLREESARHLGTADPQDMVWLAAKMVGRWPSGAPLVLAPERDDPNLRHKDRFFYSREDPDGLRCPFGAHVRRANPRDMVRPSGRKESLEISDAHRILRRGTAFGDPLFDLTILDNPDNSAALGQLLDLEDDGKARGIHFLSVHASIKSQFELVQQMWCNNPRFNGLVDNTDPIVGNADPDRPSYMTLPGKPVRRRTAALPRFVTVMGGAYLFLPSLTALEYLSNPLE